MPLADQDFTELYGNVANANNVAAGKAAMAQTTLANCRTCAFALHICSLALHIRSVALHVIYQQRLAIHSHVIWAEHACKLCTQLTLKHQDFANVYGRCTMHACSQLSKQLS